MIRVQVLVIYIDELSLISFCTKQSNKEEDDL